MQSRHDAGAPIDPSTVRAMAPLAATLAALAAASFLPAAAAAQNYDDVQIRTTQVRDNIYMLRGAGGNIGVSIGDDGTVIVDDQFAPLTEKIKAAIADITDRPVDYVINTHWHYDHSDGNENFGEAGAVIIAHENSRTRMMTDQYVTVGDRDQQAYDAVGLPKISFDQAMSLHLNGEDVEIFHTSRAHTSGDAIIYFRDADVMHTGDVFVRYGVPFIDYPNGGSINGMISAIYRLAGLVTDDTIIIPGHGQLSSKQDLLDYAEMLATIRDRVRQGIRDGLTLAQIQATNPTDGFPEPNVGRDVFVEWTYENQMEAQ